MQILLLSSERSGSNLLRVMLGCHSMISAPVPPHLAPSLAPLAHLYGNLDEDSRFRDLLQDMIRLSQLAPDPWPIELELEEVMNCSTRRTFWGAYDAVYSVAAQNRPHWFSKENRLYNYALSFHEQFVDARFIYLVRDPRDYVASMKKMFHSHWHPYVLAELWQGEQRACLFAHLHLASKQYIYQLRYEDLIDSPKEELEKLCSFLHIPFEDGMLHFYRSEAVQQTSQTIEAWKNLSRPVMCDNRNKYETELSPHEIRWIESIAWSEMQLLGYSHWTDNRPRLPHRFMRNWYRQINRMVLALRRRRFLNEPRRREFLSAIRDIQCRLNA